MQKNGKDMQDFKMLNQYVNNYKREPEKLEEEKSKVDASKARRFAHTVFMKQKLNLLDFDEEFQSIYAAIADKVAKKIATNFSLGPVVEETLENKTKRLINVSTQLATQQFTVEQLKGQPDLLDQEEIRIRKFFFTPKLKLVGKILEQEKIINTMRKQYFQEV